VTFFKIPELQAQSAQEEVCLSPKFGCGNFECKLDTLHPN
jgi:hypothetical protein